MDSDQPHRLQVEVLVFQVANAKRGIEFGQLIVPAKPIMLKRQGMGKFGNCGKVAHSLV